MQKTRVILPKFYRNFALLFFVIGLGLLIFLAYSTLGRVEIIITPAYQAVDIETIVDIKELPFDSPVEEEVVSGKIVTMELEESKVYPSSGEKEIVTNVVGQVTLINKNTKDQPLVATTRLLSPAGVLVRIKEATTIPAGGQVKVWVYPDKPEEFSSIEKQAHFTIPGLWPGLQAKIYGVNDEALNKGIQKIKTVSEEDLKNAEKELVDYIVQKVVKEFNKQLLENQTFYSKLIRKEVVSKSYDAQVGDVKDEFTAVLKIRAVVIAFDEIKLLNIVKKKLAASLPADKELKNFDTKNISYTVENYDLDKKLAYIKVKAAGQSVIKSGGGILDKAKLGGMSKQEMIDYFKQSPEVKEVEVEFYPKWIMRAPKNLERIEVIVR